MVKDIIYIIDYIVGAIDKTIKIGRIELADQLLTKLYVCSSFKWLKFGSVVIDDQNRSATVTEIGIDYIVIQKENPFIWTSRIITIDKEIFSFEGTPMATNKEWVNYSLKESGKAPFTWLVMPMNETFFNIQSTLERESEIRLLFLDITNPAYTTKQHEEKTVKYLRAWVEAFFEVIEKNKKDFGRVESYDTKVISYFGKETAQGVEATIIASNLSAIEVRFTLPIKKGAKCLC